MIGYVIIYKSIKQRKIYKTGCFSRYHVGVYTNKMANERNIEVQLIYAKMYFLREKQVTNIFYYCMLTRYIVQYAILKKILAFYANQQKCPKYSKNVFVTHLILSDENAS